MEIPQRTIQNWLRSGDRHQRTVGSVFDFFPLAISKDVHIKAKQGNIVGVIRVIVTTDSLSDVISTNPDATLLVFEVQPIQTDRIISCDHGAAGVHQLWHSNSNSSRSDGQSRQ